MAQDSKHGEESEEKYAQKQEKKSGEKDRKQAEDKNGKGKNQVSDDYQEGPPDLEQQPVQLSQSAGGRTYYFTIPIRPLSGHIPQEYLERLTLYYALYGSVFAAVGAIAIVLPLVFGVEVATLLAWLLVLGGSVTLLMFLLICGAPGTTAFLLLSALHLTAGLYLLVEQETSSSRFTLLLTGWFLLHGALKLFMAVAVRKITTWPVVLVSGISSLILAFVILVLTPNLGLNLVSITFGADLAFTGFSLLLISIMGFFGKESRSVSDADLINEPLLQGNGDGVGSAVN